MCVCTGRVDMLVGGRRQRIQFNNGPMSFPVAGFDIVCDVHFLLATYLCMVWHGMVWYCMVLAPTICPNEKVDYIYS